MGKDQGSTNKVYILVEVCNRQPNQDKETDEAFYEQLAVVQLPALVFKGKFNFPDIYWKYSTAQKKQTGRFF